MLVLERKPGQKILIGTDVIVELLEIKHGKIRLGVTAPREVPVDRSEVRDQKQAEQKH